MPPAWPRSRHPPPPLRSTARHSNGGAPYGRPPAAAARRLCRGGRERNAGRGWGCASSGRPATDYTGATIFRSQSLCCAYTAASPAPVLLPIGTHLTHAASSNDSPTPRTPLPSAARSSPRPTAGASSAGGVHRSPFPRFRYPPPPSRPPLPPNDGAPRPSVARYHRAGGRRRSGGGGLPPWRRWRRRRGALVDTPAAGEHLVQRVPRRRHQWRVEELPGAVPA